MTLEMPSSVLQGILGSDRLTETQLLRLEYFPPPAALSNHVTTFFRMRCDEREIVDVQPASVGILAVFVRGTGQIRFLDGRCEPSRRTILLTPTSTAARIEMEGPWHCFGAALSPLGWAALTGLSAAEHANRLYDGEAVLGAGFSEAAAEVVLRFDSATPEQLIAILSEPILRNAMPVPASHATLLAAVAQWLGSSLSPQVSDLVARVNYSGRQVQRLIDRYFGLPPKALARKYRALRAATILTDPELDAEQQAAVEDHFYDQSHMIREIRLFAGRTPARIADPGLPYLSAFLDLRNFREIEPKVAPLPADLHA